MKVYTYNDKVLVNSANDKWLKEKEAGPLELPGWTIRIKVTTGSSTPSIGGATVTAVEGQADVYDICTEGARGSIWGGMFGPSLIEVLGANVWDSTHTYVASINGVFSNCTNLTNVALFDTSSVTNMDEMFYGCASLTSIPLFDTSNVTSMNGTFIGCTNVESGALALYQQASTQTTPPSSHTNTFNNCGSNTVTGAAELAQIPSSWGGTAT